MVRHFASRFLLPRLSPLWRVERAGILLGLVIISSGCLHRHRAPVAAGRAPLPSARPAPIIQGEEGIASWYGHPYHGRPTASSEIYNMYDLTAAHRTLPFGTQVRVHNLRNGREVEVRINDRGPFVEGRIIDLSYAAAQAINMPDLAHVSLEILAAGASREEPGIYGVQVGSFQQRENAERLRALIEARFKPVTIQTFDRGDTIFYRVRVGSESSEDAARDLAQKLRNANLATETFVVRLN